MTAQLYQKNKIHTGAEQITIVENCSNKLSFVLTKEDTFEETTEKINLILTKRDEKQLEMILGDKNIGINWLSFLWPIVGICLGMTFVLLGFVFWPTSNVFTSPESWWDCVLQCGVVWMGKIYIRTI